MYESFLFLFLQLYSLFMNNVKYIVTFGIFLMLFASCGSRDNDILSTDVVTNPKTASGEEKSGLPVIEFEKEIHDFGKVIQGERVTYNFKFENTGKADLIISHVSSSCGCTIPKFPKVPIKPGEQKIMSVTFDSGGRKGKQNKTVTVVSNCQPNKTIVRIKAMVITP